LIVDDKPGLSNQKLIEHLVEALEACEQRLRYIHSRLVPHNYATVADRELHEDVDKIKACIGMANDALNLTIDHGSDRTVKAMRVVFGWRQSFRRMIHFHFHCFGL
jgi:hypothetical protein